MTALIAAISTLPSFRDAVDLTNLIAASDDARYWALNIPAAAFELDLIKGDAEPAGSDAFSIPAIVEVDIVEAKIIGFSTNRLATGANGAALHLAQFPATIVVVAVP